MRIEISTLVAAFTITQVVAFPPTPPLGTIKIYHRSPGRCSQAPAGGVIDEKTAKQLNYTADRHPKCGSGTDMPKPAAVKPMPDPNDPVLTKPYYPGNPTSKNEFNENILYYTQNALHGPNLEKRDPGLGKEQSWQTTDWNCNGVPYSWEQIWYSWHLAARHNYATEQNREDPSKGISWTWPKKFTPGSADHEAADPKFSEANIPGADGLKMPKICRTTPRLLLEFPILHEVEVPGARDMMDEDDMFFKFMEGITPPGQHRVVLAYDRDNQQGTGGAYEFCFLTSPNRVCSIVHRSSEYEMNGSEDDYQGDDESN